MAVEVEARARGGEVAAGPFAANPSSGLEFLRTVRRREASLGIDVLQGGWSADEDVERVRWAYAEVRALLARCTGVRQVLQERMEDGTSFGQCVVVAEEQLRGML